MRRSVASRVRINLGTSPRKCPRDDVASGRSMVDFAFESPRPENTPASAMMHRPGIAERTSRESSDCAYVNKRASAVVYSSPNNGPNA